MKLYTEEQLIKALELARKQKHKDFKSWFCNSKDDIINSLNHIKLPSDEEIEIKGDEFSNRASYSECFKEGAKWVIEQIKQQVIT